MNLSIILPAYNEKQIIAQTLDAHLSWETPENVVLHEVIVVDDGSTDQTGSIVATYSKAHPCIKLVNLPFNQGKGAALKQGVMMAEGEIIGCVDADMTYPPELYDGFVQAILEHKADIAIGNRYHDTLQFATQYSSIRRMASIGFKFVARKFGLSTFSDSQCGIKFFSRSSALSLFQHLQSSGFLYDLEILAAASTINLNIHEIPVTMQNCSPSKIKLYRQFLPITTGLFKLLIKQHLCKSRSIPVNDKD